MSLSGFQSKEQFVSPAHLVLPLLFYSGLNYGDYRTSVDAMHRGGQELSPVGRAVGVGPMKIGATVLFTAGDMLLQRDKHKATVWTYRAAITAIMVGVMVNNSRIQQPRIVRPAP
jgi:hypothetical protein